MGGVARQPGQERPAAPTGGRRIGTIIARALGKALASQADNGGVERWHARRALTATQCTEAISLRMGRDARGRDAPGDVGGRHPAGWRRRKDLIDAVQHARRVIRVWEEVRDLLRSEDIAVSGRLTLTQNNGQRVVEWRGVAKISKQFQVPTLLLDATLPEKPVLQVYHPQVEVVADIRVALPASVKVRQVLGAPTSSRKLNDEEHLDSVRRYILQRWLETGRGPTLVICQQKVEEWLQQVRPAGEHHASRTTTTSPGWTTSRTVRLKILIGRTAPGPQAMEALAAALSGSESSAPAVAARPGGFVWYPPGSARHPLARRARDPDMGRSASRSVRRGDPLAGARGRADAGVRPRRGRSTATDATPLDIDLLFDTCLPITVDEVVVWRPPKPADRDGGGRA